MREVKNRKEKTQSFMGNVAIVLFAQLAVKILGLVYRVVITNMGGFGDRGNYFYNVGFQFYTILLAISSVGIPNAIAKLVSARAAVNDYKGAQRVFKTAFVLFAAVGVVCAAILYFFADAAAKYVVGVDGVQYVMRALAPSIFFVCVSSVIRGYFQGLSDMRATSNSQILEQFFKSGLTILFVVLTVGTMPIIMELISRAGMLAPELYYTASDGAVKTLPEIMAAWANVASSAATLISFAYLVVFYMRRKPELDEKVRLGVQSPKESSAGLVKSILMLSIPISLASIITAVNRVIDTATITRGIQAAFAAYIPAYGSELAAVAHPTMAQLKEAVEVLGGALSKSDVLINMPLALNVAFATVLVPSVSGALAVGNKTEASKKISYSFLISTLIILPCAAGFIALAQPIYNLIYPAAPLGSDLLAIMAVSLIFSALFQTMSGALQGLGKVMSPAIGLVVGCVIKVVLNLLLIRQPSINIYGAAISSVACQVAAFAVCYAMLSRHLKIGITFKKYIAKPLISSAATGAFAWLVYKLAIALTHSNSVSVLAAIAAAVVLYAALLLFTRALDEEEIKMLPGGGRLYRLLQKTRLYN